MMKRRIRVLVVDDSLLFRNSLAKQLSEDESIEVVATAADPFEARDRIEELLPDVVTLDIEMPRMNGISFLKRLMPQYPLPVVVVSGLNDQVFEAIEAGAVDFVTKPTPRVSKSFDSFFLEIKMKIKIAAGANVSHWKEKPGMSIPIPIPSPERSTTAWKNQVIAIGASTGGTEAIERILKEWQRDMPGIVIVQHMPPVFTSLYAQRLHKSTPFTVKEAQDGDLLLPGMVLLAPGDKHMSLARSGKQYRVQCTEGRKISGHCPSVDVLFESVAVHAGSNAIGILLTGMGHDGARGLLALRRAGAYTIGQDKASSVVYGMPKSAFEIGAVQRQLPLSSIAKSIKQLLHIK
jgi:two-component system, chemotaxis family, protein-glutamate methylesterase/glutaminase